MGRASWAKKWAPYKSGLEAAFAKSMEELGLEFRYEPETIEYRKRVVKGICDACGGNKTSQRRTYLPDFVLRLREAERADTRTIYIETKGNFSGSDRAKMVAVKQDNPELDIRLVFGANNKLKKNKNERYTDWAKKHGFLYSVGAEFPPEWLPALSARSEELPEPDCRQERPRRKRGTSLHSGGSKRRKRS